MKNMLIPAGLLAILASPLFAAEYPNNPDHRPSIGLNYYMSSADGDSTARDTFGDSASQDVEVTSGEIVLDTRIPLSDNFTMNAHIGFGGVESEAEATPILFGGTTDTSGYSLGIGARWYLK